MKLIKQANVYTNECFAIQDVLFNEFGIEKIAAHIDEQLADEIIDGDGYTLLPGLIDVHVHLREPGGEYKETIRSGSEAAAHGGFTTIMAMPNVTPKPDAVDVMQTYLAQIKREALVNVVPYACITKGESGKEVVDMHALKQLGIYAFSDDGVGVQNDTIMMKAMDMSREEDILIVAHTEDMNYRKPKACLHEGKRNHELGYVGIPSACEYAQINRDLMLVEATHAHYHICHMSAKESVELLAQAKEKGLDVSGEVTVHHLLLDENDVQDDANYKMNPPLRSRTDRDALLVGLKNGIIDMIANDHAPHSEEEKKRGMVEAPFGIVSIETAFPLLYTKLVKEGLVSLEQLVYWMSEAPAKRFGFDTKGKIAEGYDADLILIDTQHAQAIDKEKFYSKGNNTPFDGVTCYGWPVMSIVRGNIVYKEEKR